MNDYSVIVFCQFIVNLFLITKVCKGEVEIKKLKETIDLIVKELYEIKKGLIR